ncbi:MAG: peptidyl-prolyl cis-trans isomerase, partial [Alphaproteobacteria bacterium]|nr:peptidyl-prolyl cis-trans isomerase [Alphaproteobacteria bacterium]
MQNIYDNIKVSDEDINFHYQENKADYETPETRQVLQMMFDEEEKANSAYTELQNGKDFYDVANEFAGQSKEDTDLGFAAQDELLPEIASEVYAIEKGQYTKPVKVGDAWQIMKVEDIKEGSKTSFEVAASEIEKILKDERLYDESYEVLASMEDKLAAGATLETLSQELNVDLKKVSGFAEDKTALSDYQDINDLVLTTEFTDAGFSYALGETSQVIETDKGLFALRVDAINETHPKPLDKVRDDIVNLWSDNEKSAIAQEKLNDVMHDLENGDDISSVGERYSLDVYTSRPLTRNETFDKVGYDDIKSMFAEPLNTPRQIQVGDDYIVAVAIEDYDNSVELSKEETVIYNYIYNNINTCKIDDITV